MSYISQLGSYNSLFSFFLPKIVTRSSCVVKIICFSALISVSHFTCINCRFCVLLNMQQGIRIRQHSNFITNLFILEYRFQTTKSSRKLVLAKKTTRMTRADGIPEPTDTEIAFSVKQCSKLESEDDGTFLSEIYRFTKSNSEVRKSNATVSKVYDTVPSSCIFAICGYRCICTYWK